MPPRKGFRLRWASASMSRSSAASTSSPPDCSSSAKGACQPVTPCNSSKMVTAAASASDASTKSAQVRLSRAWYFSMLAIWRSFWAETRRSSAVSPPDPVLPSRVVFRASTSSSSISFVPCSGIRSGSLPSRTMRASVFVLTSRISAAFLRSISSRPSGSNARPSGVMNALVFPFFRVLTWRHPMQYPRLAPRRLF